MLNTLFRAALIASFAINSAVSISPLTIKGSKFFADGQQFFLKGVAYQGTPDDPLIDATHCQIDADLMKSIGTNSIRVYHINPFKNHDDCMKIFADAGIYLWLHLDTFNTSIVSDAPTWTKRQFTAFTEVLDVMHQYENVGGFWIGNEVVAKPTQANATPFIKAAAADIKSYIALKQYRAIPLGYSAADVAEVREQVQNYLACEPDPKDNIDFFGLNSYEWCGDSSFKTSGYANLQKMSEKYSIPIFFSETGCNLPAPRLFTDQGAIFGPEMSGTWSGSIVYEWVQEVNNYGLVKYDNDKATGKPIPIEPGFTNLVNEWKKAVPVGIAEADYVPTFTHPECPPASAAWPIAGQVPIPKIDQAIIAAAAGVAPGSAPETPVTPPTAPKEPINGPKTNGTNPSSIQKGNSTAPLPPFNNSTATFLPRTTQTPKGTVPCSSPIASASPNPLPPTNNTLPPPPQFKNLSSDAQNCTSCTRLLSPSLITLSSSAPAVTIPLPVLTIKFPDTIITYVPTAQATPTNVMPTEILHATMPPGGLVASPVPGANAAGNGGNGGNVPTPALATQSQVSPTGTAIPVGGLVSKAGAASLVVEKGVLVALFMGVVGLLI